MNKMSGGAPCGACRPIAPRPPAGFILREGKTGNVKEGYRATTGEERNGGKVGIGIYSTGSFQLFSGSCTYDCIE